MWMQFAAAVKALLVPIHFTHEFIAQIKENTRQNVCELSPHQQLKSAPLQLTFGLLPSCHGDGTKVCVFWSAVRKTTVHMRMLRFGCVF